jgi:hypothetical protein
MLVCSSVISLKDTHPLPRLPGGGAFVFVFVFVFVSVSIFGGGRVYEYGPELGARGDQSGPEKGGRAEEPPLEKRACPF